MANIFVDRSFEEVYAKYPVVLVDVGASGGLNRRWERVRKFLRVVGFEPDGRAFAELGKKGNAGQKFINAALHHSDGTIRLHLTRNHECSSILAPNTAFLGQFPDPGRFDVVGGVDLKATRLTRGVLRKEGIDDVDFLKVDTQGSEYYILQGAKDLLNECIFGVEVEVEFSPIYEKQPLFSDVDVLLRGSGFSLFDLKRYFWRRGKGECSRQGKGQIVFADALYLKRYEEFLECIKSLDDVRKKAKIFKAVSLCLLYGLNDYAFYLGDRAAADRLISTDERGLIMKASSQGRSGVRFKGRGGLARWLYGLYKHFRCGEFYCADEELGNEL